MFEICSSYSQLLPSPLCSFSCAVVRRQGSLRSKSGRCASLFFRASKFDVSPLLHLALLLPPAVGFICSRKKQIMFSHLVSRKMKFSRMRSADFFSVHLSVPVSLKVSRLEDSANRSFHRPLSPTLSPKPTGSPVQVAIV